MVGARAHMAQAEAEVGRGREVHGLQRREALVVVDRGDGVELALQMAMEDRVARQRAGDVVAGGAQGFDGGPDDPIVFLTEQAAFTGVRIDAADGDPRATVAQLLAQGDEREHGPTDVGAGHGARNFGERDVPGDESDGHLAAGERHHWLAVPARGEELGLAGEIIAHAGESLLVDRSGDDRGETSASGAAGGEFHRFDRDELAGFVRFAELRAVVRRSDGEPATERGDPISRADGHHRVGLLWVGLEPARDEFGSDAGRISASDGDGQRAHAGETKRPRLPPRKKLRKSCASAVW